jgi:hypothetical protein
VVIGVEQKEYYMKKNKIKFAMFSDMVYYNKDLHPKPMKEYIPDWYKDINKNMNYDKSIMSRMRMKNIQTCPSFLDIFSEGYVITTPVVIEVKEDGSYTWEMNKGFDIDSRHVSASEFIGGHNDMQMVNHLPKSSGIVKILKIQFPMYVMTPPGYSCRQIPMTYLFDKNDEWESLYGVLKTDIVNELNIQIAIKKYNTKILIPQHTPLCVYVPFKRSKELEMEVTKYAEDEEAKKYFNKNYLTLHGTFKSGYLRNFRKA